VPRWRYWPAGVAMACRTLTAQALIVIDKYAKLPGVLVQKANHMPQLR
jgi:hypothetical protein